LLSVHLLNIDRVPEATDGLKLVWTSDGPNCHHELGAFTLISCRLMTMQAVVITRLITEWRPATSEKSCVLLCRKPLESSPGHQENTGKSADEGLSIQFVFYRATASPLFFRRLLSVS